MPYCRRAYAICITISIFTSWSSRSPFSSSVCPPSSSSAASRQSCSTSRRPPRGTASRDRAACRGVPSAPNAGSAGGSTAESPPAASSSGKSRRVRRLHALVSPRWRLVCGPAVPSSAPPRAKDALLGWLNGRCQGVGASECRAGGCEVRGLRSERAGRRGGRRARRNRPRAAALQRRRPCRRLESVDALHRDRSSCSPPDGAAVTAATTVVVSGGVGGGLLRGLPPLVATKEGPHDTDGATPLSATPAFSPLPQPYPPLLQPYPPLPQPYPPLPQPYPPLLQPYPPLLQPYPLRRPHFQYEHHQYQ